MKNKCLCFNPYVLNNFISCKIPCTVGNQMLLALWGSRSEILKISFWSSLVIPRSQKTITKWISWLSFFSVYWAQNKKPGRKLAHFEEFPCLTKTSITPLQPGLMDLHAWNLCVFLLSGTTPLAPFNALLEKEMWPKMPPKWPKFVFEAKIIPLNAPSGRFWIYHMKIWGFSFNLSYGNPAT